MKSKLLKPEWSFPLRELRRPIPAEASGLQRKDDLDHD